MAKIAVIEPDPQLRELFDQVVEALGHEAVADGPCDLILVEPGWPRGRSRAVRLLEEHPGLPVICVSSRTPDAWAGEVSTAFVFKPFGLQELRDAIANTLPGEAGFSISR